MNNANMSPLLRLHTETACDLSSVGPATMSPRRREPEQLIGVLAGRTDRLGSSSSGLVGFGHPGGEGGQAVPRARCPETVTDSV